MVSGSTDESFNEDDMFDFNAEKLKFPPVVETRSLARKHSSGGWSADEDITYEPYYLKAVQATEQDTEPPEPPAEPEKTATSSCRDSPFILFPCINFFSWKSSASSTMATTTDERSIVSTSTTDDDETLGNTIIREEVMVAVEDSARLLVKGFNSVLGRNTSFSTFETRTYPIQDV